MLNKEIDYLFLPSVINMTHESSNMTHSYACPYIQCLPYIIGSAVDLESPKFKLLQPIIHFEYGEAHVEKTFRKIAGDIGVRGKKVTNAIEKAQETQKSFYKHMGDRGKEVLDNLGDDEIALVIISRPYNGCDSGVNLDLPEKLGDMGILAIPMDCIPLDLECIKKIGDPVHEGDIIFQCFCCAEEKLKEGVEKIANAVTISSASIEQILIYN